jgi:hypothetical protein
MDGLTSRVTRLGDCFSFEKSFDICTNSSGHLVDEWHGCRVTRLGECSPMGRSKVEYQFWKSGLG